jgi:nucleoside-diphosphate-sugar epimerase
VNGNSTVGRAFSEADEPDPTEPYAISKWEAESALMELGVRTSLQITRIRPPLVIGAGVKGNLRRLIRLVDSHLPLPFGAIRNHRSFVTLDDLCELLTRCVTHERAAAELFLAADPQEISTPDLMRGVAEGLGTSICLVPVPLTALLWAGRMIGAREELRRMSSSLSVDAARARTMLGWQIRVGLRTGIRQMAESYLHEGRSELRSAELRQ